MARIFITGSSDGLGSLTARALVKKGHTVVLHARSPSRAEDAMTLCPGAEKCLVADLTSVAETKTLAEEVNALGPFDAVVHNAGLYRGVSGLKGPEGLPALFAVNTLAPYILTCLITPVPKRLVYVSSGLHQGGNATLTGGGLLNCGYGDSKLHNVMFASAFARRNLGGKGVAAGNGDGKSGEDFTSNSVDPGWVRTKMGGSSAMDDLDAAVDTFAMLAAGDGPAKGQTGKHWYQMNTRRPKSDGEDVQKQENLLAELERISGWKLPA